MLLLRPASQEMMRASEVGFAGASWFWSWSDLEFGVRFVVFLFLLLSRSCFVGARFRI